MSIYDPPEGYEYETLLITVDGGYERDRTVEARECSRCGAVVITFKTHDAKCPLETDPFADDDPPPLVRDL